MRVVNAFVFLILFASAALAADLVVMRDGSEQSGTLELCADDSCRLSGKRIPIAGIRAIFLDGAKKDLSARSGSILMRDGSVRSGVVTFINRGTVDTDDQEFDRSRVAAVIFGGAAEPLEDLLILRDGSVRSGALSTCNAASCTVDSSITPLASIEWIGLSREDPIPPSSSADEVHKIDGTVVAGRMSRIDATTVSTTRGPLTRAETAWVHLVPPQAPAPAQPGAFGAPPPTPPPAQPPVQPPQPPVQPPQPPVQPPAPAPGSSGRSPTAGGWPPPLPRVDAGARRGGLWTGTVQTRLDGLSDGTSFVMTIDAQVKLREKITPLPYGTGAAFRAIGSFAAMIPEGSVVRQSITCRGPGVSCDGQGTVTVSGEESQGCSGIWIRNENIDTTPQYQFSIPQNGLYSICHGFPPGAGFPTTWRNSEGSDVSDTSFLSPVIGRHPTFPPSEFMDPQARTFEGNFGMMRGSFTQPLSSGAFQTMSVSWSICREGVQCTAPPPLPPPPGGPSTPREEPAADDDEDDCANLQRLINAIRALRETYELFEDAFSAAEERRAAARDAIFGFSGTLAKFSVSLAGLASEAITGALGDLIGFVGSLTGLAQEVSLDNASQVVVAIGDSDVGFSPIERAAVNDAVRKADAFLKQTGDDAGALRTYANEIGRSDAAIAKGKNVVKGLSIVSSVKDYAEKTNGLANSIQEYGDASREATLQKSGMEDTQERMADKQLEIDEARRRLSGPCPGIPSTGYRQGATNGYQLVQSTPSAPEPGATADEIRAAAATATAVEARMNNAVTWLLPFFARVTDGVSPQLLRALLRQAEPDLRAAKADAEAAATVGREVERKLSPGTNQASLQMLQSSSAYAGYH
jgi:hypothetical protein